MKRTRAIVVVIVLALIGGSLAFAFAGTTPATDEPALGSERNSDESASRGAPRTPDAAAIELTRAASGTLTAPADEPNPTTTTSSTATVAPTTTTTTVVPAVAPEPPSPTAAPTEAAPAPQPASSGQSESGKASYYSHKPGGCAHKTIAKGTTVTVTNTNTGATATCVVNDRGPFVAGRIVDLDITVFRQIGSTSAGVVPVRITW